MKANVKANHMTVKLNLMSSCHDKDTDQLCMYWFMPRCHNKDLSNVIFAFKMSLLSERHLMTVVTNMQKTSLIFMTYVML